jgi:hypothetical protein
MANILGSKQYNALPKDVLLEDTGGRDFDGIERVWMN